MQSIEEPRQLSQRKRQKWSLVTSFWVAVVVIAVSGVTVVALMNKPVWIEMETLALVVGVFMTGFYSFALYRGVYFADDETITFKRPVGTPLDGLDLIIDGGFGPDSFGQLTAAGASEGPLGFLLGFILDVILCLVLAVVLSCLLWLGVNVFIVGGVAVAVPLFYIFSRSVLFVMRHVEECHGDLWRSFRCGVSYAAIKTALLCLIVFAAHKLAHLIKILLLDS